MLLPRSRRVAAGLLLPLCVACAPAEPPEPALVGEWAALTDSVTDSVSDAGRRAALRALAAVALYEGYSAGSASLQSLAGQVNGVWSMPVAADLRMDGAIVAAEAQRLLLGRVVGDAERALVDSLARRQVAARRAAGVRADVERRSQAHGQLIAARLLALQDADRPSTLALRHPAECALAATGDAEVQPQGTAPAMTAPSAEAAAEERALTAIERADVTVASLRTRPRAPIDACVRQRVRDRIRTRVAP